MTTHNQIINNVFSLITKAFSFESGALALISAAPAYGVKELIELLIKDVEIRGLVMPFLSFGTLTIAYVLVSALDFYTGIRASRKEHITSTGLSKGYIRSDKLWSSIWKFMGVILVGSIITMFTILFILVGIGWLYDTFLVGIIGFYFVVISFDIHSIGENQLRRFGKKPPFYVFVDDVSRTVKEGIIEKIKNKFE